MIEAFGVADFHLAKLLCHHRLRCRALTGLMFVVITLIAGSTFYVEAVDWKFEISVNHKQAIFLSHQIVARHQRHYIFLIKIWSILLEPA